MKADVYFAVLPAALSGEGQLPRRAGLADAEPVEDPGLHVHAAIVELQGAVLDAQDVELSLRLGLLLPDGLLNVGDHMHSLAHLVRQVRILILHFPKTFDLLGQDEGGVVLRLIAQQVLGQFLRAPVRVLLLRAEALPCFHHGLYLARVQRFSFAGIGVKFNEAAAAALYVEGLGGERTIDFWYGFHVLCSVSINVLNSQCRRRSLSII